MLLLWRDLDVASGLHAELLGCPNATAAGEKSLQPPLLLLTMLQLLRVASEQMLLQLLLLLLLLRGVLGGMLAAGGHCASCNTQTLHLCRPEHFPLQVAHLDLVLLPALVLVRPRLLHAQLHCCCCR